MLSGFSPDFCSNRCQGENFKYSKEDRQQSFDVKLMRSVHTRRKSRSKIGHPSLSDDWAQYLPSFLIYLHAKRYLLYQWVLYKNVTAKAHLMFLFFNENGIQQLTKLPFTSVWHHPPLTKMPNWTWQINWIETGLWGSWKSFNFLDQDFKGFQTFWDQVSKVWKSSEPAAPNGLAKKISKQYFQMVDEM